MCVNFKNSHWYTVNVFGLKLETKTRISSRTENCKIARSEKVSKSQRKSYGFFCEHYIENNDIGKGGAKSTKQRGRS